MMNSPRTSNTYSAYLVNPDGNVYYGNDYSSVGNSYGSPGSFASSFSWFIASFGLVGIDGEDVKGSYGLTFTPDTFDGYGHVYCVRSDGVVDDYNYDSVKDSYGNTIYFISRVYTKLIHFSANQITGGFALRGPITTAMRILWVRMATTTTATILGVPTAFLSGHCY